MALAIIGLAISIRSFVRSSTIVQGLLGLPAIVVYFGSVTIIAQIFIYSRLASYAPHIAIGVAFGISLLQSSIAGPPRAAGR